MTFYFKKNHKNNSMNNSFYSMYYTFTTDYKSHYTNTIHLSSDGTYEFNTGNKEKTVQYPEKYLRGT